MRPILIDRHLPIAKDMTCQVCFHRGPGNEYHPYVFCLLYRQGWTNEQIWEFIRDAASRLPAEARRQR